MCIVSDFCVHIILYTHLRHHQKPAKNNGANTRKKCVMHCRQRIGLCANILHLRRFRGYVFGVDGCLSKQNVAHSADLAYTNCLFVAFNMEDQAVSSFRRCPMCSGIMYIAKIGHLTTNLLRLHLFTTSLATNILKRRCHILLA